eukprot:TRINITY_DN11112_c0_g1_i3.p1 TRINITY_DN11112_c0_g1~~TRINITY_DN11112_c0_g1_i3.p1  ORF type:complete len:275 (+),score=18.13 TRINITY_DN11112_c0_g1_i3:68-892(+)
MSRLGLKSSVTSSSFEHTQSKQFGKTITSSFPINHRPLSLLYAFVNKHNNRFTNKCLFEKGSNVDKNYATLSKDFNRKLDFRGPWRKKLWRPNNYYESMLNASIVDDVDNELNNFKDQQSPPIFRKASIKKPTTNISSLKNTKMEGRLGKSCVCKKELQWKSSSLKTLGIDARTNNCTISLPKKKREYKRSDKKSKKEEVLNRPFVRLTKLLRGRQIAFKLTPNRLCVKSNKKLLTQKPHLLSKSQVFSKTSIEQADFKIKILVKRKICYQVAL